MKQERERDWGTKLFSSKYVSKKFFFLSRKCSSIVWGSHTGLHTHLRIVHMSSNENFNKLMGQTLSECMCDKNLYSFSFSLTLPHNTCNAHLHSRNVQNFNFPFKHQFSFFFFLSFISHLSFDMLFVRLIFRRKKILSSSFTFYSFDNKIKGRQRNSSGTN